MLAYLRAPSASIAPPSAGQNLPGSAARAAGFTLEEQEQALRLLCEQRGLPQAASFVERRRGSQEGRAFARLLERLDASPGEHGQVLVADLSLLAPTTVEAARRLLEVEHRGGALLAASHTVGDPLLVVLSAWARERQRSPRRLGVRAGMERRALLGLGLGRPAYGYRLGADGRFQVVGEEAEAVRRIFRLYAEQKLGLRRIAGQLNADNIPTKSKGPWSVGAVRDLLRNRTYLGTYRRFGVRIPGSLPRLIEPELFQAAQHQLSSQGGRGHHGRGEGQLLTGLLYCGGCGGRLTAGRRRAQAGAGASEGQYYRCPRRSARPCSQASHPRAGLEAALRAELGRLVAQGLPATPPIAAEERVARARALRAQLRRLGQRFQRCLERGAAGSLSRVALCELSREPLRLRRILEGQLARLEGQGSRRGRAGALKKLVQSWDEWGPARRRDLLLECVEKITVGPAGPTLSLRA